MSSKIRILQENEINQIAAGEVIENSASVIKELIENSIDAKATEISIEIKAGGRQLIKVIDNGIGMTKDDALLCLERHATSKIHKLDDIYNLNTMGFRGEAIPSIASVSKMTIQTCFAENDGRQIKINGGKVLECAPFARVVGTTIEVKYLFYNVPVRKKFQKSVSSDINAVFKIVSSLALSHPEVKFSLISDQKKMLSTKVLASSSFLEKLHKRAEDILGREFCQELVPVDFKEGNFRLVGLLGRPTVHRHNRSGQYLFINQRFVFDSFVSRLMREGYGSALPNYRHPVFVLHLQMPQKEVDVNVHPQKREIRFMKESFLQQLILQAIEKAMQQMGGYNVLEEPFVEKEVDIGLNKDILSSLVGDNRERRNDKFSRSGFVKTKDPMSYSSFSANNDLFRTTVELTTPPKILGIVGNYILVDASSVEGKLLSGCVDGFIIVDQRRAHFRVLYEEFVRKMQDCETSAYVETAPLLIPINLELSSIESSLLQNNIDSLNSLGIVVKNFGPNAFAVDSLPHIFAKEDPQKLILEILKSLENGCENNREDRIILAAAKAAINRCKILSDREALELVEQLMQCQVTHHCPRGKVIYVHFGIDDIAKKFKV